MITTTHIYTLKDPETNEIRYVGKTNNIGQRFSAHLNNARKHQIHKKRWIESLKKKKLKPIIEILDIVPIEDWVFWEIYWISQMKSWGYNLINYTEGGDGCTFANQTSFKKGDGTKWYVCLRKNGEYVGEFFGIEACEKFCGKIGIDHVVSKKTKHHKTAGGFLWLYKSEYEQMSEQQIVDFVYWANFREYLPNSGQFKKGNPPPNKGTTWRAGGKRKAISVIQMDLSENFIKKHYSVKEAAIHMKCSHESIRRACVNEKRTFYGFRWKYDK